MTNILILDDDVDFRCYMVHFLSDHVAAKVYTAVNNQEAYAVLENKKIDIFLIDIIREGNKCLEFIKSVRNTKLYADSSIYIVTDSGCEKIKAECLKSGATGFFNKPLELEKFIFVINASIATLPSNID